MSVGRALVSKSLESYLESTSGTDVDYSLALFGAAANSSVGARYAIVNYLLDQGADASILRNGEGILTIILGQQNHDPGMLAHSVGRLIATGADANLPDSRKGHPPIIQVAAFSRVKDADAEPLYDAMLGAVDLDLPYKYGTFEGTVGEYLMKLHGRELLQRRIGALG